MSLGRGIIGHIGLGGETSFGSKGTIDQFLYIISETLHHQKDPFMSESANPGWHMDVFMSGGRNIGGVTFELTYTGLELLFHSIFGTYTFSVDTPVAGAHTHAFAFNPSTNSFPTGISAEVVRGIGGTREKSYLGLHVSKVTINFEPRKVPTITFDFLGTGFSSGAATSATFAVPSFVLPAHKNSLTIDGAIVTILSGSITFEVPRDGEREHYGEALYKEAVIIGRPMANFSFQVEQDDASGADTDALVEAYEEETEVSSLSIVHQGDIITGTTNEAMSISGTKAKITAAFPQNQGKTINTFSVDGTITQGLTMSFINDTGAQVT